MPKERSQAKPKLGDMVESNPNFLRLKSACEGYYSEATPNGETDVRWPLPKEFAKRYGFSDFDSDHFHSCYYRLKERLLCKFIVIRFI